MLARLRAVSIVESLSYLMLLAGMGWHRLLDGPDTTPVLGLLHGVIYLVYGAAVLAAHHRLGWPAQQTVLLLFAAAVPLGGFWVAHRITASRPAPAGASAPAPAAPATASSAVGPPGQAGPGDVLGDRGGPHRLDDRLG